MSAVHRYCSSAAGSSSGCHNMMRTWMLRMHHNNNNQHRSIVTISTTCRRFLSGPQQHRVLQLLPVRPTMVRPMSMLSSSFLSSTRPSMWNDHSNNNECYYRRCFTTLPPHEIVGLPSLSPVRGIYLYIYIYKYISVSHYQYLLLSW